VAKNSPLVKTGWTMVNEKGLAGTAKPFDFVYKLLSLGCGPAYR
jgi:hypothetical protein